MCIIAMRPQRTDVSFLINKYCILFRKLYIVFNYNPYGFIKQLSDAKFANYLHFHIANNLQIRYIKIMRPVEYKTKIGEEILSILEANRDTALSVNDICSDLEKRKVITNITTVYRQLDKLVAAQKVIVHSAKDGKNRMYQCIAGDEECLSHLHIQCTECSKIIHLDCDESAEFTSHIEGEHGIKLDFSKTVLYGLCKDCRK